MAVYKRGDSYWYEFVFKGIRYRRPAKTGNKRVAEQIEAAFKTKLAKGEVDIHEKNPAPAFDQAMKDFLAWSKQHHSDHPNTYKRYLISSKPLLRFFGKLPIDQIMPERIEAYKTSRLKAVSPKTGRRLRPSTINRELACIKILFSRAVRDEIVTRNPVSRVKFLAENNEMMRVLTFEEQRRYLAECSQPLRDVATLMLETGMRPEEVYRIKAENVRLSEGYLFNPNGKTKAARRKIPLTAAAKAILQFRLMSAEGEYLFPHQKDANAEQTKIQKGHLGAVRRSGVARFRLYDLRHTFATRAAMSGVDLVTLAALLGHSRIQMVLRYAHPTEEHQFNAIRKLEAFATAAVIGEVEQEVVTETIQ